MKLLLENWRKFLKEETEIFGYYLWDQDEKIILSDKPITSINNIIQDAKPSLSGKPKGLWYSCGDEWLKWASSEMPQMIDKANYLYLIETNNKIKYVNSEAEFRVFEMEYKIEVSGMSVINWKKLQDDGFAGIEICPYMSKYRYTDWYYGWDVASGCIWSPNGIDSIELIGQRGDEDETII